MKTHCAVGLAMLAGFGFGAIAVQGLHAQAKPKAYLVTETEVIDAAAAIHLLTYYRDRFGLEPEDFPGARACNDHTMAIPLHNRMTVDDYEYIVSAIRRLT